MNKITTSIFGTLALLAGGAVASSSGLSKTAFPVKEKEITTSVVSKEKAYPDAFYEEIFDYAEHNPAAVGTVAA